MNLDDDEEDEEAAEEMKEQEDLSLMQLEKALSQCAKCGDEKRCKIDKTGKHVHLTFQQLRAWALSLVSHPVLFLFFVADASMLRRLWASTVLL